VSFESFRRKPYPSDVSEEEWAFVAPYLVLMREDAPQRTYPLRELFNAVRYLVRCGGPWRMLPNDLPPWDVVYGQMRRWLAAGLFQQMTHDLRELLRLLDGRDAQPTAAVLDSRTLQSTPESGARAGFDGAKKKKGSKGHIAVDTLGHLLALHVTPANEQDRQQVAELAEQIQQVTSDSVEIAFVDQGYTGETARQAAADYGIQLEVVKRKTPGGGFILLPRRWVGERSQAWVGRFRRLARDDERLAACLAGLHYIAFACLLVQRFMTLMNE
jgi:transposase